MQYQTIERDATAKTATFDIQTRGMFGSKQVPIIESGADISFYALTIGNSEKYGLISQNFLFGNPNGEHIKYTPEAGLTISDTRSTKRKIANLDCLRDKYIDRGWNTTEIDQEITELEQEL